jgi:hypothetical protein
VRSWRTACYLSRGGEFRDPLSVAKGQRLCKGHSLELLAYSERTAKEYLLWLRGDETTDTKYGVIRDAVNKLTVSWSPKLGNIVNVYEAANGKWVFTYHRDDAQLIRYAIDKCPYPADKARLEALMSSNTHLILAYEKDANGLYKGEGDTEYYTLKDAPYELQLEEKQIVNATYGFRVYKDVPYETLEDRLARESQQKNDPLLNARIKYTPTPELERRRLQDQLVREYQQTVAAYTSGNTGIVRAPGENVWGNDNRQTQRIEYAEIGPMAAQAVKDYDFIHEPGISKTEMDRRWHTIALSNGYIAEPSLFYQWFGMPSDECPGIFTQFLFAGGGFAGTGAAPRMRRADFNAMMQRENGLIQLDKLPNTPRKQFARMQAAADSLGTPLVITPEEYNRQPGPGFQRDRVAVEIGKDGVDRLIPVGKGESAAGANVGRIGALVSEGENAVLRRAGGVTATGPTWGQPSPETSARAQILRQ